MNPVLHSSETHTWMTPESFLELVRAVGPIGLDPCTSADNPTSAQTYMYPEHGDGLELNWVAVGVYAAGLVFCNPPYGRALGAWAAKCAEEARLGAEIILLVPARPDTAWFDRLWGADALLLWRGRIKFKGATAGAPFPSAVAYWGPRGRRFREAFSGKGRFVRSL